MSTRPSKPPRGEISGRYLIIGLFLLALGLGTITYLFVPSIILPYYMRKPAQTEAFFDTVEAALLRYRADHGAFPPTDDLVNYRRPGKNTARSRVPGVTTYRLGLLTTPVAYLDPLMPGDPYAVPEQFSPPGYTLGRFRDGTGWLLLFSLGPNLQFDIRPGEVEETKSRAELKDYLTARLYDPTNGLKSGGDFYRLMEVE